MVTIPRTPDEVLDFWLGPLRSVAATTEDIWRDRMLRWRVGVFSRAFEDEAFSAVQQKVCEMIHREGADRYFAPAALWDTPRGWLARVIVLDQFGRSVYRGTPLAYANDALTVPLLRHICDAGWDLNEYDEVERMWVYIALSHPEDHGLQELSVDKWTRWSSDLVAAGPKENRRVNQHVSWYFIKSIIEHSEAVLLYGKFPHRNSIMCRTHGAGEIHYLTNEMRPLWSFTQPPRPEYYALHAALHRMEGDPDCQALDRATVARWQTSLGLGNGADDSAESLLDVFATLDSHQVSFADLYRHASQGAKASGFNTMTESKALEPVLRAVKHAIFKDDQASWPPRSARTSVPRVIDVPALNMAIGCPLLEAGDVRIPHSAVERFVNTTGFRRRPLSELVKRYRELATQGGQTYEATPTGVRRTLPIDRRAFTTLAGDLFADSPGRDAALGTLYELLDMDYNGTVDAREIVVALNVLCSGSEEERLGACFDVFDADGSGYLDRQELHDFIHTTLLRGLHLVEALFAKYLPEPSERRDEEPEMVLFSLANFGAIEQSAMRALSEADAGGDGKVDRAEFGRWAGDHPLVAQLLRLSESLFGG